MAIRLLNYESELRRYQDKIKDIQKDVIGLLGRSDTPSDINKLVNDLDMIDIKMAFVRGTLKGMRGKYDK
jgi:hypothetical protein